MAEAAPTAPASDARMPGTSTPAVDIQAKIASALSSSGGITDDSDDSGESEATEEKTEPESRSEPAEAAEEEKAAEPDKEKTEPKTARAKEWVEIKKVKGALAKEIRSVKAMKAEAIREKAEAAELLKQQKELAELLDKDPAEYIKRASKGQLRPLLKRALEEPEKTPEQIERDELRAELAELKRWREEREKNETEREKQQREQSERQATEATRREHIGKILGVIERAQETERLRGVPKQLRFVVADMARQRIIDEHARSGHEMNILEVLSDIQNELYKQPTSETESPTRATGAVETAKTEAKRAPAALKTATVTSRVSGARTLSMDEKIRQAAAMLKPR